jgi:hypothetical protein
MATNVNGSISASANTIEVLLLVWQFIETTMIPQRHNGTIPFPLLGASFVANPFLVAIWIAYRKGVAIQVAPSRAATLS